MAVDLIFMPEVEGDLDGAFAWYEEQREGRGVAFLVRVNACVEAVHRSPEMRNLIYKHYRRALVDKFPYAVYYQYSPGTVTIHGVFHTSRDRANLRRRLP